MKPDRPPGNRCWYSALRSGAVVDHEKAQRLRPASAVHTRLFDGELVILDLEKGEYYAFDEIGTALWHNLETGKTLEQVSEEIVALYEVKREQVLVDLSSALRHSSRPWVGRS